MSTSDLEVLLPGEDLNEMLKTLLEPIEETIAKSIKGARVRVDEFKRRHRNDERGRAAAFALEQEEQQVVEHFLGLAFAIAQTAYITPVVSGLTQVHRVAEWPLFATRLTTTSGKKEGMLQHGFRPTPKEPYSKIEVMDAFAVWYVWPNLRHLARRMFTRNQVSL